MVTKARLNFPPCQSVSSFVMVLCSLHVSSTDARRVTFWGRSSFGGGADVNIRAHTSGVQMVAQPRTRHALLADHPAPRLPLCEGLCRDPHTHSTGPTQENLVLYMRTMQKKTTPIREQICLKKSRSWPVDDLSVDGSICRCSICR